MLAFAFDTAETELSRIVPPSESDAPLTVEDEKRGEDAETNSTEWNSKSAKISMYREELPSVVIEREFVTSLRTEMLLLVIVSACFHTVAYLKLKGSNQTEQDNPITRP